MSRFRHLERDTRDAHTRNNIVITIKDRHGYAKYTQIPLFTVKGIAYFSDLLLNISQKSQPYKIFSQLIQENVFTNEELDALEELIKLRK